MLVLSCRRSGGSLSNGSENTETILKNLGLLATNFLKCTETLPNRYYETINANSLYRNQLKFTVGLS